MFIICHGLRQYRCEVPVAEGDQPAYMQPGEDCLLIAFASSRWFCIRGSVATEIFLNISEDGIRSLH